MTDWRYFEFAVGFGVFVFWAAANWRDGGSRVGVKKLKLRQRRQFSNFFGLDGCVAQQACRGRLSKDNSGKEFRVAAISQQFGAPWQCGTSYRSHMGARGCPCLPCALGTQLLSLKKQIVEFDR